MTLTGTEQILSYVSAEDKDRIANLFKRSDMGYEFECIFFSKRGKSMNKEKYVSMLKYMKSKASDKKYIHVPATKSLDINYSVVSSASTNPDVLDYDAGVTVYRVTADGDKNIDRVVQRIKEIQNKNYIIYKMLLLILKKNNKDEFLSFMKKHKGSDDTVDIDELNMRVRLSSEDDFTEKIKKSKIHDVLDKLSNSDTLDIELRALINKNVSYRYKERTSLYIEDTDAYFIRIDLTETKTTKDFSYLFTTASNYELEIEYGLKKSGKQKKEQLQSIYSTAESLLKYLQQSMFIIGNKRSDSVVQYYKAISNIDGNIGNLVARQPVSLEIQHVTEILPNKYAVSDKADGDRYFLIIYQNSIYLINTNMIVKDTGIVLDKELENYNGTILDGEYIYVSKERRHLYMTFDCLRSGSKDMKSTISFMARLAEADKIIEDCFIFDGQKGFKYKEFPKTEFFDIDGITKFYGEELKRFYTVLSKDMPHIKQYPLIRRKYFMPVTGAHRWEIFRYSVEFWNRYTEDPETKFPYQLDGMIYHPLEQAYITNVSESKYHEYKWKPPKKNSIDFYIEFKKDPLTGKIVDVYDNSLASDKLDVTDDINVVRNKTYRICTLYVGKMVDGREVPTPFTQNNGLSDAYLFKKDGEIRDITGDIITDKTVVELFYQNDPNIDPRHRWVPIKTRYDKTDSVERYGKRHGNYSSTADRIWRSIINPVLIDDFLELAKGNTNKRNFYDIKIKDMNSKISHQLVVQANKENRYYQKVSTLASIMRQYHNYIKSNLIYTYCSKLYQSNNQQSVLDIGFGRGGDIQKYYYTNVAYLVGIDLDMNGFTNPLDGAISRYNAYKRTKPNMPKMYFIQADARAPLEYDAQINALNGMEESNKRMLQKFFPTGRIESVFDRIVCQFAMHYFLKDDQTWINFKQNLKKHLRSGGYFVATAFDAREVLKILGTQDAYAVYYDDSDGNKRKFFEIVKRFDTTDSNPIGIGKGIDIYMSWAFDEGTYQTEYLVDLEFIREDLLKDSDLELVDTDLFSNQMVVHKKFLTEAMMYESSNETKEYMSKVSNFFESNDMNTKSKAYTDLNRYFVFRKRNPSDVTIGSEQVTKKGKKQLGGKKTALVEQIELKYNFSDTKKFKIPMMENYKNNDYSLINSIHKLLVSHGILPKSVEVEEFVKSMNLGVLKDEEVTNEYIHDLCDSIVIKHEIDENDKIDKTDKTNVKTILNGLAMFMVERDCNNFYDITYCKPRSDTKISRTKTAKKSNSEHTRAIVLMKEGEFYRPLMRQDIKGLKGLISLKDQMILDMMENGESID
jgi:hypothetical protein